MKCAISIPDEIFRLVDTEAARLGVSRSQFYADAARRYLDELSRRHVSEQIDAFVREHGDVNSDSDVAWVVEAGRSHLAKPE
jgi:metal-responsive CopG/Arc/MetJ family transcriptional regulator